MTTITLTPDQANELNNDFWHIEYTVNIGGEDITAHTDDDDLKEIPNGVDVGILGSNATEDSPATEYYMAHPALTWEDAVIIKAELDERATFTDTIKKTPQADRPNLRKNKRQELRQQARRDARKADRIAKRRSQRKADRQAARREARQDFQQKHRAAIDKARPQEPADT
jgi:hypothetical protein